MLWAIIRRCLNLHSQQLDHFKLANTEQPPYSQSFDPHWGAHLFTMITVSHTVVKPN